MNMRPDAVAGTLNIRGQAGPMRDKWIEVRGSETRV